MFSLFVLVVVFLCILMKNGLVLVFVIRYVVVLWLFVKVVLVIVVRVSVDLVRSFFMVFF